MWRNKYLINSPTSGGSSSQEMLLLCVICFGLSRCRSKGRSLIGFTAISINVYESQRLVDNEAERDYSVYPEPRKTINASFHQGNIPEYYRVSHYLGYQSVTMSLMAIVNSKLQDVTQWTCNSLDKILVLGDKLHEICVETRQRKLNQCSLELCHLPSILYSTNGSKVKCIYGTSYTGIINMVSKNNANKETLLTTLKKSLAISPTGVIVKIQEFAFAVIMDDSGSYRLFDSHAKDPMGRFVRNGKAVLLTFPTLKLLIDYVKSEYIWTLPIEVVSVVIQTSFI